jgi:hypothetical protein
MMRLLPSLVLVFVLLEGGTATGLAPGQLGDMKKSESLLNAKLTKMRKENTRKKARLQQKLHESAEFHKKVDHEDLGVQYLLRGVVNLRGSLVKESRKEANEEELVSEESGELLESTALTLAEEGFLAQQTRAQDAFLSQRNTLGFIPLLKQKCDEENRGISGAGFRAGFMCKQLMLEEHQHSEVSKKVSKKMVLSHLSVAAVAQIAKQEHAVNDLPVLSPRNSFAYISAFSSSNLLCDPNGLNVGEWSVASNEIQQTCCSSGKE